MKTRIISVLVIICTFTFLLESSPVTAAMTTPINGTVEVQNISWEILAYTDMGIIGQAVNVLRYSGDLEGQASETLNFRLLFNCEGPGCVSEGYQNFVGTLLDGNGGTFDACVSRQGWDTEALHEACAQMIIRSADGLEGLEGTISFDLICSGLSPWTGSYIGDVVVGVSPLQPGIY